MKKSQKKTEKKEHLSYASLLPERNRRTVKRVSEATNLAEALNPPRPNRKRVGRGISAQQGKTCGRGHKGQKARSGYSYRKGFEGGQTPIYRRLPKRGFHNLFSRNYQLVHLEGLKRCKLEGEVNPKILREKGLIAKEFRPIKILGDGEISASIQLLADAISKNAQKKIESAGGSFRVRDIVAEKKKITPKEKATKKDFVE